MVEHCCSYRGIKHGISVCYQGCTLLTDGCVCVWGGMGGGVSLKHTHMDLLSALPMLSDCGTVN